MIDIHLARFASNADYTAGAVMVRGTPFCVAIELPWRDNQRGVSCIPAGDYTIYTRHTSPGFGKNVWLVMDVPGRSDILWHAANRAAELKGCIAPGTTFGALKGEFAVMQSRDALNRLRNRTKRECVDADGVSMEYLKLRITDDWRR